MRRNDKIVNKTRIVSCQSTLFDELTSMFPAVCLHLVADFVLNFENVPADGEKTIVDDKEAAGAHPIKWNGQWSTKTTHGYDLKFSA